MKRLAKLQASSATPSNAPSTSSSPPPPPAPSPKPKSHPPGPIRKLAPAPPPPAHIPPKKKVHIAPSPFNYDAWESEIIGQVFQVTLDVRFDLSGLSIVRFVILTGFRRAACGSYEE